MTQRLPTALVKIGIPIVALSMLLAARLAWEQTIWTLERGPQMVGFSLMHGAGILLVLTLWGGLLWLAAMIVMAVVRRSAGGALAVSLVAAYAVAWILVSIPYGFWQRMLVEKLAQGPHAAKFLQYAAATGDLKTVEAFLEQGLPVDARDNIGATALHAAAVGGQLAVAEFLISRGADVNAINRYGDSPLENAEAQSRTEVARYLAGRGGKRVRGSAEQRDRITSEIVREQMEQMDRLSKDRNK